MSNLTKSTNQVLMDLINKDNPGITLLTSEVTIGNPAIETGTRNSSIVITADGTGRFLAGSRTLYYNRLSLADRFAMGDAVFEKTTEMTSIADLLVQLNTRFALNLVAADFTITPWPTWANQPDETHEITFTPNATHKLFNAPGTVTVKLFQVSLEQAIPNNTLDGLTYDPM